MQYHTPTNVHAHKINRHSYFIFSEMAESEARFASASDEDIATLLSNKDSLNTKRATKTSVAVFT